MSTTASHVSASYCFISSPRASSPSLCFLFLSDCFLAFFSPGGWFPFIACIAFRFSPGAFFGVSMTTAATMAFSGASVITGLASGTWWMQGCERHT